MHPAATPRQKSWVPYLLLGLIGSLLVAILPLSVSFVYAGVHDWFYAHDLGWVRRKPGHWTTRVLALIGSLLLFYAWMRLHPARFPRTPPTRLILLAWSLPLLLVPPVETADPYAYAAQGWLLHTGQNPYRVPMGLPGPFTAGIYPAWLPTTAVYPPLALHLQHLIVDITGMHTYWSVVGMRLLAIAGIALAVAVTPALARDVGVSPPNALWAVALNPLVLIQFYGGAHNDALMVGLILLALWLAARRLGLIWSMVVIGLAASIKQPAILAGLGVALYAIQRALPQSRRTPGRILARVALAGLIGGATFLGTSAFGGLGMGWINKTGGSPSLVINHSPLSWIAQLALKQFHVGRNYVDPVLNAVSGVLILAALVWLLRRYAKANPVRFTAGTLLAFGFLGPALQPWYVLWGGMVLPFGRLSFRAIRFALAVTLLFVISGILQGFWSPAITVPVSAIPAYAYFRWGKTFWPPDTRKEMV